MTTWVTDFSSNRAVGTERWLPGFLWAVLIHLVLILIFMPTIEHSPPAAPVRITVQVSQLEPMIEEEVEVVEPEPTPEPVVPVKPPETKKKILIAKDDTPPEPDDMVVIEQPPEVEPVEEKKTEPKKVEPKPEPKKVEKPKPKPEPEKVEKPKPKPEPKKIEKPVVKPKVAEVDDTATEVVDAPTTETSSETTSSAVASSSTSSNTNATGTGTDTNEKNQGGTADVDRNTAWKGYGQLLYAMVSKNKTYPQLAIRRHLEGTVMVSVQFEKGRMVSISIAGQGSGHSVLDRAAHEMVEKAVKALPVRGNLSGKSFSVVVPVNFRLTD